MRKCILYLCVMERENGQGISMCFACIYFVGGVESNVV
jgi:hypothetical protein